eukprot:767962-Hanusia_phi.AAC.2
MKFRWSSLSLVPLTVCFMFGMVVDKLATHQMQPSGRRLVAAPLKRASLVPDAQGNAVTESGSISHEKGLSAGEHELGTGTRLDKNRTHVFWAGLEGTGHHLIMQATRTHPHVSRDSYALKFPCLLWDGKADKALLNTRWKTIPLKYASDIVKLLQEDKGRDPTSPFTFLNSDETLACNPGMMSYPNFWNVRDRYPDITTIFEIMRKLRKTLKVVVLLRNPLDTLCSCSIKKQYRSWSWQADVLRIGALDLAAQLRELRKDELTCLDYSAVADGTATESLDAFLYEDSAPTDGSSLGAAIRRSFNHSVLSAPSCMEYMCVDEKGKRHKLSLDECHIARDLFNAVEVLRSVCPNPLQPDRTIYPSIVE